MQPTIDIARRNMNPSTGPDYEYDVFVSFPITVGINVVPLSQANIPCTFVIIQASNANAGTVEVGGHDLMIGAGMELTAGRAISFSVDQSQSPDMGSLGLGNTPYIAAPQRIVRKRRVLNLRNILAVANAPAQTLRILYTVPPKGM